MSDIAKRSLSGSFANALSLLATFFQSIVLVPFFLKNWGADKYGVWIALFAFVTLMRTLDVGHQNFISNEINNLYFSDRSQLLRTVGSSLRVAFFLGAVELVTGMGIILTFGMTAIGVQQSGVPVFEMEYGTLVFLSMWLLVGSSGGILAKLFIPTGRYTQSVYLGLVMKGLEFFVLLGAASLNLSILTTCVLYSTVTVIYSVWWFWLLKRVLPDLYPWWQQGNLKHGFENFRKSLTLAITGFIEQLSVSFQIFSVSSVLGSAAIPGLTTMRTLSNVAVQVVNVFTGPITIDLVRFYVLREMKKMLEVFSVIWFVSLFFVYIPFVLISPFIEPAYHFWTHGLLAFNPWLYAFLSLSVCVFALGSPMRLLLVGINHLRALLAFSVARLVILGATSLLLHQWGLASVGVAILLAESVASFALPLFFTGIDLGRFEAKVDPRIAFLATAPVFVMAAYLFAFASKTGNPSLLAILTALVLMTLGFFHWKLISPETKQKLAGLLSALR